ncbi:hypothetical protein [Heyndrickxia sporothermodurans]|uniref:hypothetical protein n=2 Tax=Heyndrickxia sporothermodurans TaxID=46224 RepID=UPI000D37A85F|nr:hypothetical protein [Heyndrickxia sporothermodurans]
MYFSINAYKYLLGFDNTYRLCKDGIWITLEKFTSFDDTRDMLFKSYEDAKFWLDSTGRVIINGVETSTIPKVEGKLFDDGYSFEIVAHRTTKPKNPVITRQQLKNVLINGDDNVSNSLVIDYEGMPKLIQLVNRTPSAIEEYPVRFETFAAGNGYVGSISDLNHLETTYQALLEAWAMHITTGRSFYRDCVSGENTEEELIDEIESEISNLA